MTTGKTLIVGAYARRSSDQSDRDEDAKSVTQQIDHDLGARGLTAAQSAILDSLVQAGGLLQGG